MMPRDKLRKADVLAAVGFAALGGLVIAGALRMPIGGTYGGVRNDWWASPAMMPLLLGTLLILCSVIVLSRAVADGGHRGLAGFFLERLKGLPRNVEVRRLVAAALLIGLYVFALFGRINFYLAGALFLAVFIGVFHRRREGQGALGHAVVVLAIAGTVPLAIGWLFRTYLLVPLP